MKYYTDGWMTGNPCTDKTGYGGYTVVSEDNKLIVHNKVESSLWSQDKLTNNEAELWGVLYCLLNCKYGDTISTDSMVILSWINKGFTKARKDLAGVLQIANQLKTAKRVNLMWEGRDFNLAGIMNEFEFDPIRHISADTELPTSILGSNLKTKPSSAQEYLILQ